MREFIEVMVRYYYATIVAKKLESYPILVKWVLKAL